MTTNQPSQLPLKLDTAELAYVLKVKEQTIRAGLSRHGHYQGLRPLKTPNRRLLWDAAEVQKLLNGGV